MSDFVTLLAERIRARVPDRLRPDEEHELRLFRLYALLVLSKGLETTTEDVHTAWVIWMSEIDESHAALIPFAELDQNQHRQDEPFLDAIHQISREISVNDAQEAQHSEEHPD